ncbi:unnamed protein product [Rotaria sp. Silwood2]|nr:unnamed protein product [Rotaria sp. Silwood2]CAF3382129.1 unnamed protein product [Rotaria sp. Silwood2]
MSNSNTQAGWYELLPQTQILTEQEQDFKNKKKQWKKKKCHGNRRLQRFRKRCRARKMNDQTIKMLLTMHQISNSIQKTNQKIDNDKDMDDPFTMNINNEYQNQFNRSPSTRTCQMSTDHWKQSCKLLPKYKNLSYRKFKHLLSNAIPIYRNRIQQCLASMEMLQFVQQLAVFMCTYFQLKIEEDYWNYIANLSMPAVTWLSKVSKDVTQQNSINWDHTKTKINIQYRQNIIQNKLHQTEIDLYNHLQQYSSSLSMNNKLPFEQSINIIHNALLVLIQKDLHCFSTNFEQKKILLSYDINYAHLVKSFYDLNPIQEQIDSVQSIWRSKLKACKKIITQQKKQSSMSDQVMVQRIIQGNSSIIKTTQHKLDIDGTNQENQLSSMEYFASSIRAIIKARLNNIEQRTQQIIKFIYASTQS